MPASSDAALGFLEGFAPPPLRPGARPAAGGTAHYGSTGGSSPGPRRSESAPVQHAPVTTAPPQSPRTSPGPRPPLTGRATRVALVGVGYIADIHLEALRTLSGVEVVALCDVALERARAAARRHGVPNAVRDLDELGPLGIDVVHLCVPPDLHARLAQACLERGLSVFVEKPLALESSEAAALFSLATARGLVLGANHNAAFHPAFRRLLERVRQGAIGRVEHVDVQLAVPLRQLEARDFSHWMFRRQENIVFEQAVHPFSQLYELVGAPREVRAHVLATRELRPGQPFHERWAVGARAERGTAQLSFSFGSTFQQSTIAVRGTDGALLADLHRNTLQEERKTLWLDFYDAYLATARRARQLARDARANLVQYLRQTLRLAPRGDAFYLGMRGSMAAFHAAFRAGQPVPSGSAEVAGVLAWCEACVRELAPVRPTAPLAFTDAPARADEVVVVGANGFIGRHTLRALLARGMPVTAAVRRPDGWPADLEHAVRDGRLRLVRVDLGDRAVMAEALRGARTVLHLATGGGATWEEIERAMVGGSRTLAEVAREAGVARFVYVSSIAALYLGPDCGAARVDDGMPLDPRPDARALRARQDRGRARPGRAGALRRPGGDGGAPRGRGRRRRALPALGARAVGARQPLRRVGPGRPPAAARPRGGRGRGPGARGGPRGHGARRARPQPGGARPARRAHPGGPVRAPHGPGRPLPPALAGVLAGARNRQVAGEEGRGTARRLPELPRPQEPLPVPGADRRDGPRGARMEPVRGPRGLPGAPVPRRTRPVSVHVLHAFSTFVPGGPQVRTARLLPALDPDWRHSILALDGRTDARALLPATLRAEILEPLPRAGTPRTTWRLTGLLRRLRPDLVLTYNWGALDALLATRLVGPRALVHHEDGFRPDEVDGFKRRRVWTRRLVLPGTRAVIVPSHRLEEIACTLWRLPAAQVVRIPNGIRLADFPARDGNPARRAALGIPAGAFVVGSVGHLRAEKNPVRLIEALAGIEAHALVLGDGPERARVEETARALGLTARVHLVGHREAPQEDYRLMDAFALPSDTEQMPVALLEAMACGLPVAATDVGDVRRILPPAQAPLVVPRDARALGEALRTLAASPELRRELGAGNRARVEEEYGFERMVARYRETYAAALRA